MTLWIAMREGDVYALCPLLPAKWSPPPTLIPSLSISLVAKVAAMEDDPYISAETKTLAQQQLAWMSDLDRQEPTYVEGSTGEPPVEVYTRPENPGRVPKLQGPFDFDLAPKESDDELDSLLTDIHVIGAKIDSEELMLGEENELEMDDAEQEGLSLDVVCLLTSSGRLSICLNLEGVEAQWLPKANRSKSSRLLEESNVPSLLTFQVLDTSRNSEVWEGSWPMFSPDFSSRYSFYVTNTSSITFISLASWAFRLETEFKHGAAGTDLRIGLLVNGQSSLRERIHTEKMDDHSAPLAAANLLRDPDLGYFLLSATPYGPLALTFEAPDLEFDFDRRSRSPTYDDEPEKPLVLCEPRPVYQPAHVLEQKSALPSFLEKLHHSKYKRLLKEEIRLSPATLTIMTDAHKVLSEETHRINIAAAELFRRCERLQVELQTQIKKANDVANRVEAITGEDVDEGETVGTEEAISARMEKAQRRQRELTERVEAVRRKVAKGTSRVLSDKEKAWIEEVEILQRKVLDERDDMKEPWARYEQAMNLKDDLLDQVDDLASKPETVASPAILQVPSDVRRQKVQQVMSLLQRESQLVEGVKSRLERLSVS